MGVRGAPAAPTPTRRLDKKLEPRVRRPRAASMAVRNKYWRADLYPRARPQGKGNARTKRAARPAPRSATQPAPRAPTRASRPRSEESPAPRSAIRTLLKLDAAARKRGATDVLKHEPFAPANAKAAAPMARNEAAQQPLVDPVVVVNLLKLAHGCAMSASSQLPGAWRFDKRPRRGDPLLRTLICPCGARLRSLSAVERHLARGDDDCAARGRPGDVCAHAIAPAAKLSRWLHKHDGGLVPSD